MVKVILCRERSKLCAVLNHLFAAKRAELNAPQLSGCPQVHPQAEHIGIPKALVSYTPLFAVTIDGHCTTHSTVGREDSIEGNASRALHTAACSELCLDSLAEMLIWKYFQKLSLKSHDLAYTSSFLKTTKQFVLSPGFIGAIYFSVIYL